MHISALQVGKLFFELYTDPHQAAPLTVLDVGGMDVNGSLRSVAPAGCLYTSVDLAPGPGVDHVLEDPYHLPYPDNSFDVVLSSSCFEHDEFFWLTFMEILRVLRDGGLFLLDAPSNGNYHAHPQDNWRFYPDAGLTLTAWGQRNKVDNLLLESFVLNQMQDIWNDFVAVFRKGSDQTAPPTFLHDRLPGATNIRRLGHPELLRFIEQPEDIRIQHKIRKDLYEIFLKSANALGIHLAAAK